MQISAEIRQAMEQRLATIGVSDGRGNKLELTKGRFTTVVGRVCDDEPLFLTHQTLGLERPDRMLRGLAAAAVLCDAEATVLAVHGECKPLLKSLKQESQGTQIKIVAVPPRYPMDPESLICDLAQQGALDLGSASLERVLVLDAVALSDLAEAMEGRHPTRRVMTIAGDVRQPGVRQVVLGTTLADLVEACGGCADFGWIPFANGVLGGARTDPGKVIDRDSRGVVILPHDHSLVLKGTTPLADLTARAAGACVNCRICTDLCPVHLNGRHLQPHRIMQAMAAGWAGSALEPRGAILGALECLGCGHCSTVCPTRLDPARVVSATARQLAEQGVTLDSQPLSLHPHPDRDGRRTSVARITERLGLASYIQPLSPSGGVVIPTHITVPPWGPGGGLRAFTLELDQPVGRGDLVALAPAGSTELDVHSPISGRVIKVDPDDGLTIQAR